ncbi:conserved hypothetical protein, partial [Ixodes scapularis]
CQNGYITFEVITGSVYSAPSDTIELKPGTLQLTECLNHCKRNATCQSINFETGLCVLFTSSATERPASLAVSQFPVFTLYAQKICLFGELDDLSRRPAHSCSDSLRIKSSILCKSTLNNKWLAEASPPLKVVGGRLLSPRTLAIQICLIPRERRSLRAKENIGPKDQERPLIVITGCVARDPVRLCEFRSVNGKILKTVDAVFQNITTLEDCRRVCLHVPYRCHSFDMGDPANSVCRISHHARASLSHIDSPYLEIPGATTNELAACYNVTIQCKAREMVAKVKTSKVFNGKVYAKARPNSCVTDVVNSLDFQIRMAYHELECDIKQESLGQFSTDIVIQHHDMIVTNQDLGLSVHCQYDLTNRSVSNGVQLEVDGREVETSQSQLATVSSPNVTMRITDRFGEDVFTAEVGDPLALRFEIVDSNSPYEIFVRELVAMDGVDSNEILLVDSLGGLCHPVGAVRVAGLLAGAHALGTVVAAASTSRPFLDSSTPGGDQFEITPRLRTMHPDWADQEDAASRARGGRSGGDSSSTKDQGGEEDDDELVVVQTIHITDKFGFARSQRRNDDNSIDGTLKQDTSELLMSTDGSGCVNVIGLIVACSLFLMAQVVLLLVWGCVWQRRRKTKLEESVTPSIDILYSSSSKIY